MLRHAGIIRNGIWAQHLTIKRYRSLVRQIIEIDA